MIIVCPKCGSHDVEIVQCLAVNCTDQKQGTSNDTNKKEETKNDNDKKQESGFNLSRALLIGGAVVAAPCLAASAVGFGTAGIVGGSVAAGIQSTIGNVAAGSLFATMQSLGATGSFVYGATAGSATAAAGFAMGRKEGGEQEDIQNGTNKSKNGSNEEETTRQIIDGGTDPSHSTVLKVRCKRCGAMSPLTPQTE